MNDDKIWYKNQRAIRTIIQAVVGAVPAVVALIGILADAWPSEWLTGALAVGVAIQGVLARIMANETINAWLIKYTPFGSAPQGSD